MTRLPKTYDTTVDWLLLWLSVALLFTCVLLVCTVFPDDLLLYSWSLTSAVFALVAVDTLTFVYWGD